jgi:DNA-binding HxlR family transcriptional regulator
MGLAAGSVPSNCNYTFFVEVGIFVVVPIIKDIVCKKKIDYTYVMNTPNHISTPIQRETCASHPVGRALHLLGDVWTLIIVYTLLTGKKRFGELLEVMDNVSPKTLSQRLKMLEKIGFVQREAFMEIPPRVEYSLTEKGLALIDIMEAIKQFGERYLSEVESSPDTPSAPPMDEIPRC